MRLCMFHPLDHPMERGWVGRIDGGRVVHLAAQTLQSFFTGGGTAREHAEYPRVDVRLLAPVLHPRDPGRSAPKDRDFALGLGPTVCTADSIDPDGLGALVRVDGRLELTGAYVGFDWAAAIALAADGTELKPGDVIGGPGLGAVDVPPGAAVELEVEGIGVLDAAIAA
jgi:hypothetical protein